MCIFSQNCILKHGEVAICVTVSAHRTLCKLHALYFFFILNMLCKLHALYYWYPDFEKGSPLKLVGEPDNEYDCDVVVVLRQSQCGIGCKQLLHSLRFDCEGFRFKDWGGCQWGICDVLRIQVSHCQYGPMMNCLEYKNKICHDFRPNHFERLQKLNSGSWNKGQLK